MQPMFFSQWVYSDLHQWYHWCKLIWILQGGSGPQSGSLFGWHSCSKHTTVQAQSVYLPPTPLPLHSAHTLPHSHPTLPTFHSLLDSRWQSRIVDGSGHPACSSGLHFVTVRKWIVLPECFSCQHNVLVGLGRRCDKIRVGSEKQKGYPLFFERIPGVELLLCLCLNILSKNGKWNTGQ